MKPCNAYRVEHSISKLGPFEHAGQIIEVVSLGIHSITSVISDIDEIPDVKNILKKNPEAVFAFNDKLKCLNFIRDFKILSKHGFVLMEYLNIQPLYIAEDGQVIFIRNKENDITNDISNSIPKNFKNLNRKKLKNKN